MKCALKTEEMGFSMMDESIIERSQRRALRSSLREERCGQIHQGRDSEYGIFIHFRECYTLKELREAIDGFVNLGAEMIILRLDPTMKNLEQLGEVAEVIDDLRRNSAEVNEIVNKKELLIA